jgi:hypothetical protein
VLTADIEVDGFTMKLPCFGKFEVCHKEGKRRRIPLPGKIQMTADKRRVEFITLARLRELERKQAGSRWLLLASRKLERRQPGMEVEVSVCRNVLVDIPEGAVV